MALKTTVDSWKKSKRHKITLPSGVEVEIEVPNLRHLMQVGEIPNNLIDDIGSSPEDAQITPELLQKQQDFYNKLIKATVKAPEITESDVQELPYEDIEFLTEIALRQRESDALGKHIGGLDQHSNYKSVR